MYALNYVFWINQELNVLEKTIFNLPKNRNKIWMNISLIILQSPLLNETKLVVCSTRIAGCFPILAFLYNTHVLKDNLEHVSNACHLAGLWSDFWVIKANFFLSYNMILTLTSRYYIMVFYSITRMEIF